MALEIEVKFFLSNPESLRRKILGRIPSMGGRSGGRVFERNVRYEDEGENLFRQRSLLRLRQDRRVRLTFKRDTGDASGQDRRRFKIFEELEVEVSDFSTMAGILEALGYRPVQVYEKWRETFEMERSQICMDTMPFGEFIEIEGERDAIPELAEQLGLDWERRILDNYLRIFARLKDAVPLPFNDITFDNFKRLPSSATIQDFSAYIQEFECRRQD